MEDIKLLQSCAFIVIIFSMSYSEEFCGDVKITSPKGNTFNVSLNDLLNMTFQLKSDNFSSTYLITVEKKEQDRPMIICRVQHNRTSCFKTGTESNSCRCVNPSGPVEFWEKLVRPGDVEYRFRLTDISSGKYGEKKIKYHITTNDKKNGQHLLMIQFIFGPSVGLILLVVAVVIISSRCHTSSPSGKCFCCCRNS